MTELTVIVVGGGVVGLATGRALARAGARVRVLERATVAHDRGSSHGLTRAIRYEYGPREIYSRMVGASLDAWAELAASSGRHLYTETGVLALGQEDDGETLPGLDVMNRLGLPAQRLSLEECVGRFPQFEVESYSAITYNPRGGMLYASECLHALAGDLRTLGGELHEGVQVARVEPGAESARVYLQTGDILTADRVVVAAGPWIHDILPDLTLPVRPTHQQVCYFSGVRPGAFSVGSFPVFLAEMAYYGFPTSRGGLFKVASHITGREIDPNQPFIVDEDEVEAVRDFLRLVIPEAALADISLVDVCLYDMTPDEDFILDVHPASATVIIGSGFSGHGFKFGPVLGDLLAAFTLGTPPAFPIERFRLARFQSPPPGAAVTEHAAG